MGRPLRIIDPDGVYHIICRGNNKSSIFHSAKDYKSYLSFLEKAKKKYVFVLYHYVLMPNHVHMLIRPKCEDFSSCMHLIQTSYAKYYCRKYNFVGHVWQGRFKSLLIENDAYLLACGNYIEMNPVRAGLVSQPEDWAWSSAKAYLKGETDPLMDFDPLFKSLSEKEEMRRRIYRQLLPQTRAF